jgi:hypothetical protein
LERHRSAALGLVLALATAGRVASAQATTDTTTPASAPSTGPAATDTSGRAEPASNSVPSLLRDVQANAFVSFGYLTNLNRPADEQIGLRFFDSQANTFSLDVAELVLQKTVANAGDVGFRVDFEAGSAIPGKEQSAGLSIGESADLQQAFLSYVAPVGTGLRLDVGKFVTHMGYEVIEGYDGYNDQYSRSLLFNYAIPLTHTGVKATYAFSPQLSFMAEVVNGWDAAIDNNKGKSIGAQLALLPISPVAIYLNYIGGPEIEGDNGNVRHVFDLIATLKVSDALSLGLNADYGTEDATSVVTPGDNATWKGVAGYAKITTPSIFSLGLRAETFKDDGGTRLGIGQARANEVTLTPTFKIAEHFVVRAEGRYDWVDQAVFTDRDGATKKNQATLGINGIFVY